MGEIENPGANTKVTKATSKFTENFFVTFSFAFVTFVFASSVQFWSCKKSHLMAP